MLTKEEMQKVRDLELDESTGYLEPVRDIFSCSAAFQGCVIVLLWN